MSTTSLSAIDIAKDAVLSAKWLNSPWGVETLRLLGNIVPDNFTTTVAAEEKRLTDMVNDQNTLVWAIKHNNQTVGVAVVRLEAFDGLRAPNITLFLGDIHLRGKGIGTIAQKILIDDLVASGYRTIYARALTRNIASSKLLNNANFMYDGPIYTDKDGLEWQNYKYDASSS